MDDERDRWGRTIWSRFRPESAAGMNWDDPETEDDAGWHEQWRREAERVRAELIGDGNAVVDRARFERMCAIIDLLDPTDDPLGWLADLRTVPPPEWVRAWADRVFRSLDTLQPGDTNALPH